MNKNKLFERNCKPCKGTETPLGENEIARYLNFLDGWAITNEETLLVREYKMRNFMEVINFINRIAKIAQEQGHHPDLHLTNYKHLRIDLQTHAIGGLSENDFIVAAKINAIT
ncbi:MAG: 4a-hydroxytetrahydrobiopterin dehydratase [Candidatus Aceula meridiana]|nr:4a-hydroxytetrahydrobiopterin dehydratase [Candidatus Aceula meridiana]